MQKSSFRNQIVSKGTAFLLTMLLIAIVSTIALAVGRLMVAELRMTGKLEESTAAYFAAEAGIEDGLLRLKDPNIALPITNEQINISNREVAPSGTDKYYKLSITNSASQIVDEILKKDEVFEISNPTASNIVMNYKIYNADTETFRPIKYGVEVIKIDQSDNITREFCSDIDTSLPLNNINTYECIRPVSLSHQDEYKINIQSGGFKKIRIKPWGYNGTGANSESDPIDFHIKYSMTPSLGSGEIQLPIITIKSTGFFGKTQRTLEAPYDSSNGQIIGLFDFTIFQGGD